jgi:glutathione S-transferase
MAEPPVLWHLKVSHYNEKARWTLDFKDVPHVRKAVIAGTQAKVAAKLTGGSTTPILELDGRAIGDSTDIIAALETSHPDPPLYPADPAGREQALALEDFFDEELGPYARQLAMYHLLPDAKLFLGAFAPDLRGAQLVAARAAFPALRRGVVKQFSLDDEHVARAFEKLRVAGERRAAEAGPSGYLVGDTFTVADLTLAALLSPLATPEQFPYPQPQRDDPRFEPVREAMAEAELLDWVREMYARHRPPSKEL